MNQILFKNAKKYTFMKFLVKHGNYEQFFSITKPAKPVKIQKMAKFGAIGGRLENHWKTIG